MRKNITLKTIALSGLLIFTMLASVGCNTNKEEPVQQPVVEKPVIITDEVKIVKPIDIQIDLANISDSMLTAAFDKESICDDENGNKVLTVMVYDYEKYDLVDISELKEGDVLFIRGEEVTVESIEEDNGGIININGGLENGGYWLKTDDSGIYYEIMENDHKKYFAMEEITLPISEDFVLIDNSDLDNPELEYTLDDLLSDENIFLYGFNELNTVIRVADGKLVEVTRIFIP